jgi:hypothetical protein
LILFLFSLHRSFISHFTKMKGRFIVKQREEKTNKEKEEKDG